MAGDVVVAMAAGVAGGASNQNGRVGRDGDGGGARAPYSKIKPQLRGS